MLAFGRREPGLKMLIHQLLSKFPLEVIVKLEDIVGQYVMVQENAQRRVSNAKNTIFRQDKSISHQ